MHKLILIAGPSGAGKTTISDYLANQYGIPRVVTHTTRPIRKGEVPNKSYYFETEETFQKLHFFEHVHYGSYQYGSSREALNRAWEKNDLASLIVNIDGVRSYIDQLGDQCCFLYVTTSSKKTLVQRLVERGDDPAKIKERLSGAELNELPADLRPVAQILINDDLNKTKQAIDALVAGLKANEKFA